MVVTVRGDHHRAAAATTTIADSAHAQQVAEALAARIRGVAETGGTVGDLERVRLPVSPIALLDAETIDRAALASIVGEYWQHRGD